MEIKPEHQQRLDSVLEAADLAFWAEIVKAFLEATAGDYPPDLTFSMHETQKSNVLWWLNFNAPQVLAGYVAPSADLPEDRDPDRVLIPMLYIVYFEDKPSTTMYETYGAVLEAYPDAIKIDEA